MTSIKTSLPSSCHVIVPNQETALHDVISRWSDSGVSMPMATVVPYNEEDISTVVKYASENDLKIIPGNGGHGSFVPIDSKTIYLDLKKFNDVKIDREESSITLGGGAITEDVSKVCMEEGYYTFFPNSNAVGMTGAFLGGGSSAFNGLHGFAIDHILSIRIITIQSLKPLILTPASTGAEAALFNTLCGAGHGLGIITSLTLRAFPLSRLRLKDETQIWQRKLIFPPTQIAFAAELYRNLLPPPPAMIPVLIFARAPPNAPVPGEPMVMLLVSYYGPESEAEVAAKEALSDEVKGKAIVAETAFVPFEKINAGSEPFNGHGGFKEYAGAMCKEIETEGMVRAFESWRTFTEENEDARARSYVVVGSWNTDTLMENKGRGEKFFNGRDRGLLVQCTPWYSKIETKGAADRFGRGVVEAMRERDEKSGRKKWAFANNMVLRQDMSEVYDGKQVDEVKNVKKTWDPSGIFWSPIIDGW